MEIGPSTGTATATIAAPPEVLFDLITDVARMGEWSPECTGAEVPSGAAIAPGATFTGTNARGEARWTSPCVVVAAQPHRLFAFTAGDPEAATTWTYELRDRGDGTTEVVESFDSLALRTPSLAADLEGRHAQLVGDMGATLAALRAVAERDTPS